MDNHAPHPSENPDPLLSVPDAGQYLGTGERYARRLIAERRIAYVKVGRHVRIRRSALDGLIAAGEVEPGTWGRS